MGSPDAHAAVQTMAGAQEGSPCAGYLRFCGSWPSRVGSLFVVP